MSFALCHIKQIMPGWQYIYIYMYIILRKVDHMNEVVYRVFWNPTLWHIDIRLMFVIVCLMQLPNPPVLLQIVHSHRIYATGIFTYIYLLLMLHIPHMDPMGSKTHHLRNDLSILEVLEPCSYLVAFSGAPWRHVLMKRWWELGKHRSDCR